MKPYVIDSTQPIEADMLGEVRAGFPSLADEEPREKLDLIKLLVRHPASTFFFQSAFMGRQARTLPTTSLIAS